MFGKFFVFCGHLRMDQNGKLISVKKKKYFLAFLTKILDPQNFTFALENGHTSESQEKVLKNNIAWDVANNRYVNCFPSKKLLKVFLKKI